MPPARPTRRARRARALLVTAVLAAAACTADETGTDTTEPATTSTTTTTVPARAGNGTLTIGVLLPSTGSAAQLGGPMINAVRLAVERINEAGGVLGQPVLLVEQDEGGSVSSAGVALDELIESDVDAIVGPASSLAALSELDAAVAAGMLTCSPTASALSLDDFPDDGLFFRTIPSDSLQALAIAQIAELTGATGVSIAYLDDVYGRGLADAVESQLPGRNLQLAERRGFLPSGAGLDTMVAELLADDPGVVMVLGDADSASAVLTELGRQLDDASGPLPRILVNDAVRAARSTQAILELPDRVRSQITGLAPAAVVTDRDDLPGPYAAHAYDCVNLIALAAERAGTDAPARVASQMAAVSVGGSVCRTYQSCLDRLRDGLQIDYQGPSGRLELSTRTGSPTTGRFETFTFDDEGRDVSGPPFDVSSR